MNPADPRQLAGLRFGLSISAPPDMPLGGDPEQAVNSLTVRFASSILLEGGGLLLGHRWQPGGIMEHLAFQARDSRWPGLTQTAAAEPQTIAPILNLIAWPDEPPSEDQNAKRMIKYGILQVRRILPPQIPIGQFEADPARSQETDLGKLARIRALTAMRQEMALHIDARICLGGAGGKSTRRLPGVIEEALLTHTAGKPLFVAGALGGAAKAMADAILHRTMDEQARAMFFTPPAVVDLFAAFAQAYPVPDEEGPSTESGWNALRVFETMDLGSLARQAGLTDEEYIHVLTSPDVMRVLALAITGTLRFRKRAAAQPGVN